MRGEAGVENWCGDTSEHNWLEGRGERIHLIAMIDDATSRFYARFVRSDSTEENMRVLWGCLEKHGRPIAFYTGKASLFRTAERRRRDEPGVDKDPVEMPPTRIGRALFGTLPDVVEREPDGAPAHADDANRPLDRQHNLAAILSHVETRQVSNGYLVRYQARFYRIDRRDLSSRMRNASVRVKARLDGTIATRYADLRVEVCPQPEPRTPARVKKKPSQPRQGSSAKGKSRWMQGFWDRPSPPLNKAIAIANATN